MARKQRQLDAEIEQASPAEQGPSVAVAQEMLSKATWAMMNRPTEYRIVAAMPMAVGIRLKWFREEREVAEYLRTNKIARSNCVVLDGQLEEHINHMS